MSLTSTPLCIRLLAFPQIKLHQGNCCFQAQGECEVLEHFVSCFQKWSQQSVRLWANADSIFPAALGDERAPQLFSPWCPLSFSNKIVNIFYACGQHLSLPVLCGFWPFLQFLSLPDINGNKFVIIFNKCLTTLWICLAINLIWFLKNTIIRVGLMAKGRAARVTNTSSASVNVE